MLGLFDPIDVCPTPTTFSLTAGVMQQLSDPFLSFAQGYGF
jgi:hypothetical protein